MFHYDEVIQPRFLRPAVDAVDVAASTAVDFVTVYGRAVTARALSDGNLVCVTAAGESRTLAVAEGEELPLLLNSVAASNTVPLRIYIWE